MARSRSALVGVVGGRAPQPANNIIARYANFRSQMFIVLLSRIATNQRPRLRCQAFLLARVNPAPYTTDLNADGTVAMRLNCNRGRSTWSAKPIAKGTEGSFQFGLLAMTRALCPPPTLDERIAKDMTFVRSFLLKDGRLYLSLMADGGIYVWEPRG